MNVSSICQRNLNVQARFAYSGESWLYVSQGWEKVLIDFFFARKVESSKFNLIVEILLRISENDSPNQYVTKQTQPNY